MIAACDDRTSAPPGSVGRRADRNVLRRSVGVRGSAAPILILTLITLSCGADSEVPVAYPPCERVFTETAGEIIPVAQISVPHSSVAGSTERFKDPCKPVGADPLFLSESNIRTHQLVLSLDHIHPIESVEWTGYSGDRAGTVGAVSIDVSLNGISYQRVVTNRPVDGGTMSIALGGEPARHLRFVFAAGEQTRGVQDIRLTLADGYIVKEDPAWSGAFFRRAGWTGADGIFAYNLAGGDRRIGAAGPTLFVFSDTIVGDVFPHNSVRSDFTIINNTLGYFDPTLPFEEAFDFVYGEGDGRPLSIFDPDAYLGKRARHLLDGDGLTASQSRNARLTNSDDGTMWRSDEPRPELTIDLLAEETVDRLYLWNYNADPSVGVKTFELSASADGSAWRTVGRYSMAPAGGSDDEPWTLEVELDGLRTRYLQLRITEGHGSTRVGLGKIMIFGPGERFLFGRVTASSEATAPTDHERSARLWLQDGIVAGDTFYTFPLLVKDWSTIFKVHSVGVIGVPIVAGRLDHERAVYYSTPLQVSNPDGGVTYFGAGVLDNRPVDGFVYVYGYKDLDGRHLVVARLDAADILNVNRWSCFDGTGWSPRAGDAAPLKEGVSPELSVTRISEGRYAGKYMLVAMEKTTSGRVVYAVGESPWGPFDDFRLIYQTSEASYLERAFTYNAKLHAHLSEPGNYLVSYNVNTFNLGALRDARIYHPRFVRMVEVGRKR